ncbi:uncharacterized protein BXZ73DRAFT_99235 [Epithele typhae]|uniref:uncharacterized protein n=1 Tax=Epithele typhae TaxID=378194 RepID=UPI00200899D5|nr:uncharacterized protein BXZ73DRAFT_99235 [Epithele typhae]KAH9939619.1 hypothetical protein BXZ73DRAFT_99235 [Epithele typhae]
MPLLAELKVTRFADAPTEFLSSKPAIKLSAKRLPCLRHLQILGVGFTSITAFRNLRALDLDDCEFSGRSMTWPRLRGLLAAAATSLERLRLSRSSLSHVEAGEDSSRNPHPVFSRLRNLALISEDPSAIQHLLSCFDFLPNIKMELTPSALPGAIGHIVFDTYSSLLPHDLSGLPVLKALTHGHIVRKAGEHSRIQLLARSSTPEWRGDDSYGEVVLGDRTGIQDEPAVCTQLLKVYAHVFGNVAPLHSLRLSTDEIGTVDPHTLCAVLGAFPELEVLSLDPTPGVGGSLLGILRALCLPPADGSGDAGGTVLCPRLRSLCVSGMECTPGVEGVLLKLLARRVERGLAPMDEVRMTLYIEDDALPAQWSGQSLRAYVQHLRPQYVMECVIEVTPLKDLELGDDD